VPWFRVARFFLVQQTKTGINIPCGHKIYQIATKYTKWKQNIPINQKVYKMTIKYTKSFHSKAFYIKYTKINFFGVQIGIQSGNPSLVAWLSGFIADCVRPERVYLMLWVDYSTPDFNLRTFPFVWMPLKILETGIKCVMSKSFLTAMYKSAIQLKVSEQLVTKSKMPFLHSR
jgi:hypothetical protein